MAAPAETPEIERKRRARIAENEARFEKLGLKSSSDQFALLKEQPRQPQQRRQRERVNNQQPSRRSARIETAMTNATEEKKMADMQQALKARGQAWDEELLAMTAKQLVANFVCPEEVPTMHSTYDQDALEKMGIPIAGRSKLLAKPKKETQEIKKRKRKSEAPQGKEYRKSLEGVIVPYMDANLLNNLKWGNLDTEEVLSKAQEAADAQNKFNKAMRDSREGTKMADVDDGYNYTWTADDVEAIIENGMKDRYRTARQPLHLKRIEDEKAAAAKAEQQLVVEAARAETAAGGGTAVGPAAAALASSGTPAGSTVRAGPSTVNATPSSLLLSTPSAAANLSIEELRALLQVKEAEAAKTPAPLAGTPAATQVAEEDAADAGAKEIWDSNGKVLSIGDAVQIKVKVGRQNKHHVAATGKVATLNLDGEAVWGHDVKVNKGLILLKEVEVKESYEKAAGSVTFWQEYKKMGVAMGRTTLWEKRAAFAANPPLLLPVPPESVELVD